MRGFCNFHKKVQYKENITAYLSGPKDNASNLVCLFAQYSTHFKRKKNPVSPKYNNAQHLIANC